MYSGTFLCALAYLLVDYARPQDWFPFLGLLKPGMLALGAGILALVFSGRFPKDRQSRYLLGFLFLMAVSVPLAVNRNRAFWQTWAMTLLLFGGVFPIAVFTDTFERYQKLLRFWLIVHISLAFYAISHNGQGAGSFLSDENDLALAMNTALPYAVSLAILERRVIPRLIAVVATFSLLFASVSSMSRGGFIGLACVGFVMWLQSRRKVAALAVLAVLSASVYLFTPAKYWQEVASIGSADKKGDTGYQRIYSWGIGWRMYLDNPVIGVGPNNYPHRAAEYEDQTSDQIGYHMWGRHAHSLYFTLLPELGTVGTLLFIVIVGHGVRSRYRLRRRLKPFLARKNLGADSLERARWLDQTAITIDSSLLGFLSSASFLSVLYYPHIWVLTGISCALHSVGESTLAELESGDHAAPTPRARPIVSGVAASSGMTRTLRSVASPVGEIRGRMLSGVAQTCARRNDSPR